MTTFWGETIAVEFIEGDPEYDSFADAVSGAESREELSQRDNKVLDGETIVTYLFSGRVLALRTNTGKVLTLYVGSGPAVEWHLADGSWELRSDEIPPIVNVRFPSGRKHEWRWRELLDRIVGHRFDSLSPSDTAVSLYVRDCPDLRFSALRIAESSEKLLFFGEE